MYISYDGSITKNFTYFAHICEDFPEISVKSSKAADVMELKQDGKTVKLTENQAEHLHYILSLILGYDCSEHENKTYYQGDDE